MGRLTKPDPTPDGDGWITALYPVPCTVHKSPIPAGGDYRLVRDDTDGIPRRVCRACVLLKTVIGQPLTDPRDPA